jgi:hypothetical protein
MSYRIIKDAILNSANISSSLKIPRVKDILDLPLVNSRGSVLFNV